MTVSKLGDRPKLSSGRYPIQSFMVKICKSFVFVCHNLVNNCVHFSDLLNDPFVIFFRNKPMNYKKIRMLREEMSLKTA